MASPGRLVFSISIWVISTLSLLALTGCGGTNGTGVPPQPPPQPSISIMPNTALVPIGTDQQFFAAVANASNSIVSWTASTGTIDQAGNYVAPSSVPKGGVATVTATLVSDAAVSASATATISAQPVTLTVSPSVAAVKAGFSTAFTATVVSTTNTSVVWSVSDFSGDSTYPGSIIEGTYTAPDPVLTPDSYSITATSNADPSKTASASVMVIPLENQEEQKFPIELGASGVNANTQDCCSGTLGSLLVDQTGKQYILSNNHVMGRVGHAKQGEDIVQPGYVDTLCDFRVPRTVATFTAAPSIDSNVDAAIAEVVPAAVDPSGGIIGLGGVDPNGSYITAPPANTIATPAIGMTVAKSGRTTGLSCGVVEAVNGTILVDLPAECGSPSAQSVLFQGQVVLNDIVQPGDSGSLIVEAATAQPIALVAGLSSDGQYATANPATDVINKLNAVTGSSFGFVGGGRHPVNCSTGSNPEAPPLAGQSPFVSTETATSPPFQELLRAAATQSKYQNEIMRDPAILGVAVSRRRNDPTHAALLVFVEQGRRPPSLPAELDGFSVQLVLTGRFGGGNLRADGRKSSCGLRLPNPATSRGLTRLGRFTPR
jgi:hypothetical protein